MRVVVPIEFGLIEFSLIELGLIIALMGLSAIVSFQQGKQLGRQLGKQLGRQFTTRSQPKQLGCPSLIDWKIIDLTQPLQSHIPIWTGDPAVKIEPWSSYTTDGYFINRLSIGEHSGTHWATPNTFIPGAKSAEQFSAAELVLPALVIDIRSPATSNPDYQLSVKDILQWEKTHGKIPPGSLVMLCSGWQDRWGNPTEFFNLDELEIPHFPGFGLEATQFLLSQRQVKGFGTDTHGIDPGNDRSYAASLAIYTENCIVLECLNRLDQLPPRGAIAIIGGLPIHGGSGSPARIFALVVDLSKAL